MYKFKLILDSLELILPDCFHMSWITVNKTKRIIGEQFNSELIVFQNGNILSVMGKLSHNHIKRPIINGVHNTKFKRCLNHRETSNNERNDLTAKVGKNKSLTRNVKERISARSFASDVAGDEERNFRLSSTSEEDP